jgi:hypothetical protein
MKPVLLSSPRWHCLASASAQDKKITLNLETAKKMAAACEARQGEGWKMNIAIPDAGANRSTSCARMTRFGSVIAQLKANTSSNFPFDQAS